MAAGGDFLSAELQELLMSIHGKCREVEAISHSLESMCECRLRAKGREPLLQGQGYGGQHQGKVSPSYLQSSMLAYRGEEEMSVVATPFATSSQQAAREGQEYASCLPLSLHLQTTLSADSEIERQGTVCASMSSHVQATMLGHTVEGQEGMAVAPMPLHEQATMLVHTGEGQEGVAVAPMSSHMQATMLVHTGEGQEGVAVALTSLHMQTKLIAHTGEAQEGAAYVLTDNLAVANEYVGTYSGAAGSTASPPVPSCPQMKVATHNKGEEDCQVAGFGALPEHLQLMILALLPLHMVFKLRSVCMSWNSLLRSQAFVESCLQKAGGWFVMASTRRGPIPLGVKEFFAYVPSQQKFFPLPDLECHPHIVSCLGLGAVCMGEAKGVVGIPSALGYGICGASGLLCSVVNSLLQPHHKYCPPCSYNGKISYPHYLAALVFNLVSYSVVVFNPFTGALQRLPPSPKCDRYLKSSNTVLISMFSQDSDVGNHYFVVLYDQHQGYNHLEVYDSRTDSWKIAQARSLAQECANSLPKGNLFHYDEEEVWLFSYNVRLDAWCKIQLPCPPPMPERKDLFHTPCIGKVLQCGEHTLLAAPLFRKKRSQGFAIWQLEQLNLTEEKASWVLLSRSPAEVWKPNWQHVRPHDSRVGCDYSFVTSGTLICMTWETQEGFVPIVYDLVCNSWYNLPKYKGSYDYVCLFYFQPSLNAKPLQKQKIANAKRRRKHKKPIATDS